MVGYNVQAAVDTTLNHAGASDAGKFRLGGPFGRRRSQKAGFWIREHPDLLTWGTPFFLG
jgi:hypothetical protein